MMLQSHRLDPFQNMGNLVVGCVSLEDQNHVCIAFLVAVRSKYASSMWRGGSLRFAGSTKLRRITPSAPAREARQFTSIQPESSRPMGGLERLKRAKTRLPMSFPDAKSQVRTLQRSPGYSSRMVPGLQPPLETS